MLHAAGRMTRKPMRLVLLQVDGRLSVEALVLSLHVGEAREVVGINKGKVDLVGNEMSPVSRSWK